MSAALPASVDASTQPEMARTIHDCGRVDQPFGKSGRGHERLIGRARRIDACNGPILKGVPVVIIQLAPGLAVDAAGDAERIVPDPMTQNAMRALYREYLGD